MIKKKMNYDVETHTKQLVDTATDEAGKLAYGTLAGEEIEISNEYHIPFHAVDYAVVKTSTEETEVDDPTCQNGDEPTPPTPGEPTIVGANNTSVRQATDFDLTAGVKAYDADGNEIPFTVSPSEIDKCDLGAQVFTYSAEGVSKDRTITVTQIPDPTISGLTAMTVEVGEEFDPLEGVSAVDGNGKPVEVTYESSKYPFVVAEIGKTNSWVIGDNLDLITVYPFDEDAKGYAIAENVRIEGVSEDYGDIRGEASCGGTSSGTAGITCNLVVPYGDTVGADIYINIENREVVSAHGEVGYDYTVEWDKVTVYMTEPYE